MKKIISCLLVIAVFTCAVPAFAAQGQKGASAKALEKASSESKFNQVGDWFATIGKSEEEKQAIIAKRKAERSAKQAEKEAAKKKKAMEKEAGKKKKEMKKKAKKADKEMKKKAKGLKVGK